MRLATRRAMSATAASTTPNGQVHKSPSPRTQARTAEQTSLQQQVRKPRTRADEPGVTIAQRHSADRQPRAGGDEPGLGCDDFWIDESPPHARG